ncbi:MULTISPECIES: hypothetical protein [unclassified Streptomyces]|uniref:hypothetical protein n=1 Tax=unclassified Streptomyces TaxID=2593676 RepID=UPI0029A3AD14|nr:MULTISPECIES: hypothetical protein [unclassified Streptomyces]MDX3771753.1 hypothetical protein [Streptomyces sp. AK08-01B]MDX3820812.1 hypothetical protein [Streptomyces sp. AK08-01A]
MVMIALLLPVLLMLMLFGLDALENFLVPQHTDRSQIDATDAGEPENALTCGNIDEGASRSTAWTSKTGTDLGTPLG